MQATFLAVYLPTRNSGKERGGALLREHLKAVNTIEQNDAGTLVLREGRSSWREHFMAISRGNSWGILKNVLYREAPPVVQPLTLLFTIFDSKGTTVFSYTFY